VRSQVDVVGGSDTGAGGAAAGNDAGGGYMKPERLVLGEQDQVHSFVPQARRHAVMPTLSRVASALHASGSTGCGGSHNMSHNCVQQLAGGPDDGGDEMHPRSKATRRGPMDEMRQLVRNGGYH